MDETVFTADHERICRMLEVVWKYRKEIAAAIIWCVMYVLIVGAAIYELVKF